MRDLQEMAPPSGKYQLQFLWWVWSHCRNPEGSGTQEGKTYRGEAAEQDDAAAAVDVVDDVADAAVVAGQKPVGTVAAWRRTEPEQPAADTSSAAAAAVGAWPVVAAAEAWPVAAAVVGAWPVAAAAAAAEAEATAAQPVGTGGIGVAVHLHVVAALPGGGDAVVAAADANHQVVAAAGLCVVDCWPVAEAVAEAVWMVAQSQEWELSGRC